MWKCRLDERPTQDDVLSANTHSIIAWIKNDAWNEVMPLALLPFSYCQVVSLYCQLALTS